MMVLSAAIIVIVVAVAKRILYDRLCPLSINPYYGSSNITGYGGGGMMYSPYSSYGYGMNSNYPYYGGHNYNTLTSPFNMTGFGHPGITNLLFNFQSIVFSLGQTIQVRRFEYLRSLL